MIVYEKENKLNISFENSVRETPDIQIGKSGNKTQILVDGQESGGSGSGGDPVIVDLTTISDSTGTWSGATWEELVDAFYRGMAFLRVNSEIAPGVTGQMVINLEMYVDTGTESALYALLGGSPIILDNLGGVSGNLP